MISEADNLRHIVVNSELEALLLEAKLINSEKPKYNSVSKDDKHPLYITITKDEFPRIITSRRSGNFGPFPSSSTLYSVLRMLRKIFPYSEHKTGRRKCLYAHIGLCNPCPNEIKTKDQKRKYLKNIKSLGAILSGKIKTVQRSLEKEMKILSEEQKFEEASLVRDQLKRLEYITQPAIPSEFYLENPNLTADIRTNELKELSKIIKMKNLHRIECYDVSHLSGVHATASMVVFVNGEAEKREYRHFRIRQEKSQSDYDSIREIAKRRAKNKWGKADLIIVDGGVGQVNAFQSNSPVVGIAKNPDRLILGKQKIRLKGTSLNFVSRIRDEAHRFARRYHHKLVSKNLIQ